VLSDDNELAINVTGTFGPNANYFEIVLLVFAMMVYKHPRFAYMQVS
jgi:hypothetical protein